MTAVAPVRASPPHVKQPSSSTSPRSKGNANQAVAAALAARRHARNHVDYLSDQATTALIRRTLCSQQLGGGGVRTGTPTPTEELLPPLTSRNDVDLQLYAFLAIILRDFVQSWYGKITPDETFVAEIIQIVAHVTRALEQRLRKVDLESLVFDELPDLFDRHVAGEDSPC
jgi:hypothetical protein